MPEQTPNQGLQQNVAGLLAYVTVIPAIIFLVMEPYNKNPFIRFHAFQSIGLYVAAIVFNVALQTLVSVTHLYALFPLFSLVGLVFLVVWIMCMVKAYNNEKMQIPVISDFASQQAG